MTDDFDPAIKAAPLPEQINYWTDRVAQLEASAPPGVSATSSKTYPLRQARAELARLLGSR